MVICLSVIQKGKSTQGFKFTPRLVIRINKGQINYGQTITLKLLVSKIKGSLKLNKIHYKIIFTIKFSGNKSTIK